MSKKLITIFICFMCVALKQNTMFRTFPRLLKNIPSIFTREFLYKTQRNPELIERIKFFSQIPLDPHLKNRMHDLLCEQRMAIAMILSKAVWAQQKQIVCDLQENGALVKRSSEVDKGLDWELILDKDGSIVRIQLKNDHHPSDMQMALIS